MSIKVIHIILISCAIVLTFGFGFWSMAYAQDSGNSAYRITGIVSFILDAALIFYGIHFLKKIKSLT